MKKFILQILALPAVLIVAVIGLPSILIFKFLVDWDSNDLGFTLAAAIIGSQIIWLILLVLIAKHFGV